MLACDFQKIAASQYDIIACSRADLDVTSLSSIRENLTLHAPDIVLNCAAYTQVDDAEDIGKKANFDINTLWVGYLAEACREKNIDFITISTDYVFDGEKSEWYHEQERQNPINSYGMAKYLWEKLAQTLFPQGIIVRTSWLYGGGKEYKNFVNTMLRLSETRNELMVVNDQFGIPTYTWDLANALIELIETIDSARGKTFHFSNTSSQAVSWASFAEEIFMQIDIQTRVNHCDSTQYPTKAQRPKYSLLLNQSPIQLPDWKEWLKKYLNQIL